MYELVTCSCRISVSKETIIFVCMVEFAWIGHTLKFRSSNIISITNLDDRYIVHDFQLFLKVPDNFPLVSNCKSLSLFAIAPCGHQNYHKIHNNLLLHFSFEEVPETEVTHLRHVDNHWQICCGRLN